ncbi:MAG: DUF2933 domain-containing protein [Aquabacterium sp.]
MEQDHHDAPPFWRSPAGLALLVALVIGGFFLVKEHTAHLLGALPYLLLLACPLMHVFMHRGHGHQHGSSRRTDDEQLRK